MSTSDGVLGRLEPGCVVDAPELLAEPVRGALASLPDEVAARCRVAEIDPKFADTVALCEHYGAALDASANCGVVVGKRGGQARYAGCVVLATARVDVNNTVRRRLDVRKASFAGQDDAVARTGMAYGGITPLGLPDGWLLLLDPPVVDAPELIVGSGLRSSKLILPGAVLAALPGAEVLALS